MNLMRKLGWTFLLLSSGMAGGCAPPASAPLPPPGAPAPPGPNAQPGQPPEADAAVPAWPWLFEEEDEFEGDGWSFWGR